MCGGYVLVDGLRSTGNGDQTQVDVLKNRRLGLCKLVYTHRSIRFVGKKHRAGARTLRAVVRILLAGRSFLGAAPSFLLAGPSFLGAVARTLMEVASFLSAVGSLLFTGLPELTN